MIEKYRQLSKNSPVFQDDTLDDYCSTHHDFVNDLKAVRDSLLHQRYNNLAKQRQYVEVFTRQGPGHMIALLIEGARTFDAYLMQVGRLLLKNNDG